MLAALYVIITGRCNILGEAVQRLLTGLVLITMITHGVSAIEWLGDPSVYDDISDFTKLALPLFWFFFFYTYHQDSIYVRQLDSERKYRTLIEQSLVGIYIIQGKRFVFANKKFQEIFDYTDDELKELPSILDLVHEDDRNVVTDNLNRRISGEMNSIKYIFRGLRKDGTTIFIEVHSSRSEWNEAPAVMGILADITETRKLIKQLSYEERHDRLTGLINRQECERRITQLLQNSHIDSSSHVLCELNIDQFRVINDTCGNVAGDSLIQEVTRMLKQRVRKADKLIRLGGDNFGILLTECSTKEAEKVSLDLLNLFRDYRFEWQGKKYGIRLRMGIAPFNKKIVDSSQVFSMADIACDTARQKSGSRIHIYSIDDEISRKTYEEMQLAARLNDALDKNQFVLYWQPIVAVSDVSNRIHYEVLIRMLDESGNIIPPGMFLPPAEKYGMSVGIDQWVVNTIFSFCKANPGIMENLSMCAINLSGQSIGNEDLLNTIISNIKKRVIQPNKVCFEITETAVVTNLLEATRFIETLKQYDCKFSLDDFGTGMSSFSYLKSMPVDYLKIDGSFVKNIDSDPIDFSLVKSINEIGHVMGKKTIAEFVENDAILARLSNIGVDYAQGYGIGKPEPIKAV